MPKPYKTEKRTTYLKRCIPQLITEGKRRDQAVAVCISMFDKKK